VVKSLQAANLGDDANTTPAICGQICAYYGETGIPVKWLERLFMRVEIRNVANQLAGFFS
jgi:ADP-ribosyl-[dinitrogen reductase] hydrolase